MPFILLTVYFAVQKLHFSVIDKRKIDVYRSQYEHQRWMEKENIVCSEVKCARIFFSVLNTQIHKRETDRDGERDRERQRD